MQAIADRNAVHEAAREYKDALVKYRSSLFRLLPQGNRAARYRSRNFTSLGMT